MLSYPVLPWIIIIIGEKKCSFSFNPNHSADTQLTYEPSKAQGWENWWLCLSVTSQHCQRPGIPLSTESNTYRLWTSFVKELLCWVANLGPCRPSHHPSSWEPPLSTYPCVVFWTVILSLSPLSLYVYWMLPQETIWFPPVLQTYKLTHSKTLYQDPFHLTINYISVSGTRGFLKTIYKQLPWLFCFYLPCGLDSICFSSDAIYAFSADIKILRCSQTNENVAN